MYIYIYIYYSRDHKNHVIYLHMLFSSIALFGYFAYLFYEANNNLAKNIANIKLCPIVNDESYYSLWITYLHNQELLDLGKSYKAEGIMTLLIPIIKYL